MGIWEYPKGKKLFGDAAIGEWSAGLHKEKGGRGKTMQAKLHSLKEIDLTHQIAYKLEQLAERKALIDEAVEEAMTDLELCTRQPAGAEHCRCSTSSPCGSAVTTKTKVPVVAPSHGKEYLQGSEFSLPAGAGAGSPSVR